MATMPLEDFQPAVRDWFARRLGAPTAPQREGWPRIRAGRHVLTVRATDGRGDLQTDKFATPHPDGASGYHKLLITVG